MLSPTLSHQSTEVLSRLVRTKAPQLAGPFLFILHYFEMGLMPKVPSAILIIPYAPKIITSPMSPHIIAFFPSLRLVSSPACATNSNTPQRKTTNAHAARSRIIGLIICATTLSKKELSAGIYLPTDIHTR